MRKLLQRNLFYCIICSSSRDKDIQEMTIAVTNSNLEVQEMFDTRSFFAALVREQFDALTIGQILNTLETGKGKWLVTVDEKWYYAFPL